MLEIKGARKKKKEQNFDKNCSCIMEDRSHKLLYNDPNLSLNVCDSSGGRLIQE